MLHQGFRLGSSTLTSRSKKEDTEGAVSVNKSKLSIDYASASIFLPVVSHTDFASQRTSNRPTIYSLVMLVLRSPRYVLPVLVALRCLVLMKFIADQEEASHTSYQR